MAAVVNSYVKQKTSILTAREKEYLILSSIGCTNYEIARVLTVSLSTVKKTFECIFLKLNAKNKTNAVTIAFAHKILSVEIISAVLAMYFSKLKENNINQNLLL